MSERGTLASVRAPAGGIALVVVALAVSLGIVEATLTWLPMLASTRGEQPDGNRSAVG